MNKNIILKNYKKNFLKKFPKKPKLLYKITNWQPHISIIGILYYP